VYEEAVVMGILQGVMEWLPIGTSGHAMLALMDLLGVSPEYVYTYSLMIHLGALMALAYKFRYELGKIFFKLITFRWGEEESFIFYSTLFTGIVGLPVYKALGERAASLNIDAVNGVIGVLLIITGIVLHRAHENPIRRVKREKGLKEGDEVGIVESVSAGIAQGVAILPGISRSGITIGALLLLGVNQEKAVRLSFLIALPAIFGNLFLEAPRTAMPVNVSIVAVLTSFVVSLATLEVMLRLTKKLNFSKFCILFGSIALVGVLI